jgi:hypothetical protein
MLLYVDDLDRLGTDDKKAVEVRLGYRAGARQGIDCSQFSLSPSLASIPHPAGS